MIELMKYTYMMEPYKIGIELDKLWNRYVFILNKPRINWEEINEARAILFLTGKVYCEDISTEAIKRRLHLLKEKLNLIEFFSLIDKNSEKITHLREDEFFKKLEVFYKTIKEYKNKYIGGKYYLNEEEFIKKYSEINPNKELKLEYSGNF